MFEALLVSLGEFGLLKGEDGGRLFGRFFEFFYAITAAENHALTLVEETHYQLITTGIERVREHVKEELDENGNVIKRVREITTVEGGGGRAQGGCRRFASGWRHRRGDGGRDGSW